MRGIPKKHWAQAAEKAAKRLKTSPQRLKTINFPITYSTAETAPLQKRETQFFFACSSFCSEWPSPLLPENGRFSHPRIQPHAPFGCIWRHLRSIGRSIGPRIAHRNEGGRRFIRSAMPLLAVFWQRSWRDRALPEARRRERLRRRSMHPSSGWQREGNQWSTRLPRDG